MVRLHSFALPALSLLSSLSLASSVFDLTPKNFDDKVFSGTPSLVEFFAPWCGHCKSLAPVYEELADSFATASKKNEVYISKVDADEHKSLGTKFGVSGFPTIKYFDGKSKQPADYQGGRDLESLQKFITEKTGLKPKRKLQSPSDVTHLTDSSFSQVVGKDKDVLVAFTAPWCGHCKTLAPIWEKVATDFAPDNGVVIAKVDAEEHKTLAKAQDVSSYPTILFFPKGSTVPEKYSGGRSETAFLDFVNDKAGTDRVAGGALGVKAGTIAALDNIVAKMTGEDLESISTEVKKAAAGLKDKYAEYYLKVLGKLHENQGYVEKEMGRLKGLMNKGGLSRSMEDDFERRLNVLKKFVVGGDDKTEL